MTGYVVEFGHLVWRQFLSTGGNLQFETIGGDLGARLPRPNIEGVLRLPCNLLARDDITARIRASPLSNPDLPIYLLRPESKVVAFNAADHTGSQVLHVVDFRHQLFIGIGHQQIGGWDGPVVFVPQ